MYIAIDFGSSNTRVASSRDLVSIRKVEKFDTNPDLDKQRELIKEAINKVSSDEEVSFIGLGIHGMINKRERKFVRMPNYGILDGKHFRELLGGMYDESRLFVENDAAVAGLGEAKFGSGIGYDVIAYLTISTGIGGAKIINQNIEKGATFEPGHQIIVRDGKLNPGSGIKGDLEVYASGKYFKENFKADPSECEDLSVWQEYASYLSAGIHNVINMWSPEVIVLGGGLGYNQFEHFYPSLKVNLQSMEFVPVPEIKKSALGDEAGLYGAFALIKKS